MIDLPHLILLVNAAGMFAIAFAVLKAIPVLERAVVAVNETKVKLDEVKRALDETKRHLVTTLEKVAPVGQAAMVLKEKLVSKSTAAQDETDGGLARSTGRLEKVAEAMLDHGPSAVKHGPTVFKAAKVLMTFGKAAKEAVGKRKRK